jgi:hypothetical protein
MNSPSHSLSRFQPTDGWSLSSISILILSYKPDQIPKLLKRWVTTDCYVEVKIETVAV